MIRKAIIVMLTLAALATVTIGVGTKLVHGSPPPHRHRWQVGKVVCTTIPIPTRSLSFEFLCDTRDFWPTVAILQHALEPKTAPSWMWMLWNNRFVGGYFFTGCGGTNTEDGEYVMLCHRGVFFRIWFLALVFAAYPTIAFIRGSLRRWRRRRRGLCIRCGYNLEGNVSGVCPECGDPR